jgi:glycosyltransferase involved in cell wall biosynthesis
MLKCLAGTPGQTLLMRFLFVKARLEWPRTYGHDVHCYEMMRALGQLGHAIALATETEPRSEATAGLALDERWIIDSDRSETPPSLSYLQERYRNYWGVPRERLAALRGLSNSWRADVVVVVGLEILPYLAAPVSATRVWYAADEWVWHYVSQLASDPRGAVAHLKTAAIKGLYERAYGPLMDRVWVVSETERRAMRFVSGAKHVDIVPNGVDAERFAPIIGTPVQHSIVFWGRLGFLPNLQALRWFCGQVWPLLRESVPDASFTIAGADPPDEIAAYAGRDGIRVIANPLDLRPTIGAASVVVMPFVSGGGIKNKFLEAAAMGRPIVATSRATRGLRSRPPAIIADTAEQFSSALQALWRDPGRAASLGADARTWVTTHHTWQSAAETALRALREARSSRVRE